MLSSSTPRPYCFATPALGTSSASPWTGFSSSSADGCLSFPFFFQAEDGIRDYKVTGVQTCALPISRQTPALLAVGPGVPSPLLSRTKEERRHSVKHLAWLLIFAALPAALVTTRRGPEDESVFVHGLKADQHESLLYVWTSDADQKDPDFLTVIDVDPKSPGYGKIVATAPTGSTE